MLRTRACLPALLLLACGGNVASTEAPRTPVAADGTSSTSSAASAPANPAPAPSSPPVVTPSPSPAPAPTPSPTPSPSPSPSPAPAGGLTWTAESYGSTAQLAGIWGSSANDVYAVGGGGLIVHSRGDGAWQALTSNCSDDLHAIWGASASEIYVVGAIANPDWTGSVLRSSDGGATWTLTRNAGSLNAAVWGNATDLFVADYHVLYRSTDRGATFTSIDLGVKSAYALWGDDTHVFAGGDEQNRKLVLTSDDAFASFDAVEPGDADGVLAIGGSGGEVWVTGAPGRVYRSTDGGATFTDVTPSGSVPGLTGIFSAAAGDVWIVGNGAVFHTSDDGVTWQQPQLPASGSFSAVWGASTSDVFIVGGGAILHGQG